ncbi:MAG: ABA4-like family protein [Planctomycetota bacterium]
MGSQRVTPGAAAMAETFFSVTNSVALLAWVALILFPARRAVSHLLCAIVVPALLAVGYAAVIGWKLVENGPPPGDPFTIGGLKAMFADDWVFAAAWAHYLVFDMVVGAWIARDAVRLGIPWPVRTACLVLTFLLGPVGFMLHVVARLILRRAVDTGDGSARPTP